MMLETPPIQAEDDCRLLQAWTHLVKRTVSESARKAVRTTSAMPLMKTMPGHLHSQEQGLAPFGFGAMTLKWAELLEGIQYLTEASSRLMMAKERVIGPIWLKMTPIWTMPCRTLGTVKSQDS